jgi:hypothetical protein
MCHLSANGPSRSDWHFVHRFGSIVDGIVSGIANYGTIETTAPPRRIGTEAIFVNTQPCNA